MPTEWMKDTCNTCELKYQPLQSIFCVADCVLGALHLLSIFLRDKYYQLPFTDVETKSKRVKVTYLRSVAQQQGVKEGLGPNSE